MTNYTKLIADAEQQFDDPDHWPDHYLGHHLRLALMESQSDLTKSDDAFSKLKRQHAKSDVALVDAKAEVSQIEADLKKMSDDAVLHANDRRSAAESIFFRITALPKRGNTYQVHVADLLEIMAEHGVTDAGVPTMTPDEAREMYLQTLESLHPSKTLQVTIDKLRAGGEWTPGPDAGLHHAGQGAVEYMRLFRQRELRRRKEEGRAE